MKRFMIFAVGILMFLAANAAPTYDVGQQQTDQVLLMQQADGQMMTVDFVYADNSVVTIATTAGTEYTIYEAMPMEVRTQVFDLTMPVFRLCNRKANAFKSNLYTGWRGLNSNPPSQYDRA